MLVSIALVIILGLMMGKVANILNLPSLIGFLLIGIILGPYALNLLSPKLLEISPEIRSVALIVILTRAGLSLDFNDLKKVGRPAILMCFVPACFEILGTVLLAPKLLGISFVEALLLGSVISAVSPAVVVPRMIHLMKEGYGQEHKIPQIILAGSSVDDVFVLVLFTAFIRMNQGQGFSAVSLLTVPVAIALGAGIGLLVGWLLVRLFVVYHLRDTVKVLIVLATSFLLMGLETYLKGQIPFSGMLAVMSLSLMIYRQKEMLAERLQMKFNKFWILVEIFLFVLVGASVNVSFAIKAGFNPLIMLFLVAIFRMVGVYLSLVKSPLTGKERLFSMVAYLPKATVQAAIGSIPLALGLASGEIILTVAVLSILVTAPIGAWLIDRSYPHLLDKGFCDHDETIDLIENFND